MLVSALSVSPLLELCPEPVFYLKVGGGKKTLFCAPLVYDPLALFKLNRKDKIS